MSDFPDSSEPLSRTVAQSVTRRRRPSALRDRRQMRWARRGSFLRTWQSRTIILVPHTEREATGRPWEGAPTGGTMI